MNDILSCILTGFKFDNTVKFDNSNPLVLSYEFAPVGRVKIALSTYTVLVNKKQTNYPVLAGICRNAFENEQEPPLINEEFLSTGIKNYKYPTEFREKAMHLLRHLYNKGGKAYKTFDLSSPRDYPICYGEEIDEFNRVMNFLEDKYLIKWKDSNEFGRHRKKYLSVQLTDSGIEQIDKELPAIPLIGLVTQKNYNLEH